METFNHRVSLQSSYANFQKKIVLPKMEAILNFRIFRKNCKTQKCLYLENRARKSDFDEIFGPQGTRAEYPFRFSKKNLSLQKWRPF